MYDNVARSYQQTQYLTANPAKLILLCYEGAVSSLKLARDSYAAKEYEAKGKALQRTLDIIHELNASLDMEKGGKIAANLRSLYVYMTQILIEADLKRDVSVFDRVIQMLMELEGGWREIASRNADNTASIPREAHLPAKEPLATVSLARSA